MAKRKCEPPLLALLPPCKRPQCELPSRSCAPPSLQGAAKRRRKAELVPSTDRERRPHTDGPAAASPPPSKKSRVSPDSGAAFQCQKDEAFQEYNAFHFWRTPLPDLDFSELVDGAGDDRAAMSTGTDALEEMDN
ncbi:hypothetical protein GDO78_006919 [Eleutherodactylus coqui]|uniref:WW-binding domain-containing protein n=1 Tax=Eleutherodactylus coqui TaxID=57060 RepID=A0A8J6FHE7_ELECQ|nr:hypothetical protein GDO78_006919 [Eleutherodactylus coqui]